MLNKKKKKKKTVPQGSRPICESLFTSARRHKHLFCNRRDVSNVKRMNRPVCGISLEILGPFVGSARLWKSTPFVGLTLHIYYEWEGLVTRVTGFIYTSSFGLLECLVMLLTLTFEIHL